MEVKLFSTWRRCEPTGRHRIITWVGSGKHWAGTRLVVFKYRTGVRLSDGLSPLRKVCGRLGGYFLSRNVPHQSD